MYDLGICQVKIVDGSGHKAFTGNVWVKDDTIIKVEQCMEEENQQMKDRAREIIDGRGYVLSPGFIDTHSHSDIEVFKQDVLWPKIRQGITTEFLGQDGISMAPMPKELIDDWKRNLAGLDGTDDDLNWNYETVEGYLHQLEQTHPTSNMAYLIPHGNVRSAVVSFDNKVVNQNELKTMQAIVREGMEAGAYGLSTGLIYNPCMYGNETELIALCRVVAEYDGVFVVHQRSEANNILTSMDEILRIGRASGVRIHFSHFKLCGKENWHLLEAVLKKLDHAKEDGMSVSYDMYPYTAGSTMLSAILPPFMHEGGTLRMLERLKDPIIRERINKAIAVENTDWDNFIAFAGLEGIYITSVRTENNRKAIGMNLQQLGEWKGKNPLEATYDLLIEEENEVGMIDYYGSEEHIQTFVKRPEMNVCTDGLLGGKVHPRAYGAFPRMIHQYVNRQPILTLEEAIYKMTGKPADVFGIRNRGYVKEGYKADLVLLCPTVIKDCGTYLEPDQFPEGIIGVWVNGRRLVGDDLYQESKNKPRYSACGKVMRMEPGDRMQSR